MKRKAFALATAAVLAAACHEITGLSGPQNLLLSGVWEASAYIPGTLGVKIATSAIAGHITGIGIAYLTPAPDTLRIGGQYSADGTFGLDIAFDGGRSAAFTGTVQGTGALTGTWRDWSSGLTYDVTFIRLAVPPCSDSVPLTGSYDPNAPGFIVMFQDTVNAAVEAARLGALYGFTPTHVYTVAPKGFSALIPLTTVTVLRCEPKVTLIEYDAVATTQ